MTTPLVHLAGVELRRLRRSRLTRAALLALISVPLLYGALYLWAFWDPYGNLSKVPAALVVEDRPATTSGTTVHAGSDLAHRLTTTGSGFGWHVTSASEAADGLDAGRYYLVVTVPAHFSARLASAAGSDPRPAVLDVRTDDANGYLAGQLYRSVLAEIRASLASGATKSYVSNVYVSLAELHDQLGSAASSAEQLGSGTSSASSGARSLSRGTADVASGARSLATGARQADAGADQVSSGAATLAAGLDQLTTRTAQLPAQTSALAAGAAQVAAGADRLTALPGRLTTAAQAIDGARADTRAQVLAEVDAYAVAHPDDAGAATLASDVRARFGTLDTRLGAVSGQLRDSGGDATALVAGARGVSTGAARLAQAAPALTRGVSSADAGAHRLSSGAASLATGTGRLATGAQQLDAGARRASSGAASLAQGLRTLDDGTHRLADGLSTGARNVPDDTGQAATERAGVVADPVHVKHDGVNAAATYGVGFAPYFVPLALWVGALVTYMLLRPLAPRSLVSSAPASRVAAAGWLPAAALGLVQAGALLAVLHWGLGLDARHPVGLAAFLALVTLTYTAIMQWIGARFGAPGRLLALILLMLQLTSAGGTYPIETAPAFFRWLHPLLPMSYVVTGMRHLVSGDPMGAVWQSAVVLSAFAVAAGLFTTLAARRQRVWTLSRLHPELAL